MILRVKFHKVAPTILAILEIPQGDIRMEIGVQVFDRNVTEVNQMSECRALGWLIVEAITETGVFWPAP